MNANSDRDRLEESKTSGLTRCHLDTIEHVYRSQKAYAVPSNSDFNPFQTDPLPTTRSQDLASGPPKGTKVPELKVLDLTGEHKDKEVDYTAERKDKPTVYLFVDADKWDRPMARFLRTLEEALRKDGNGPYIVAVWLTGNTDQTKEYLPRAQKSLQLQATALCCHVGEKTGPNEWHISSDAHLTVVVAQKQRVATTFGYRTVNETDAPAVCDALKMARAEK